MQVQPYVFFEGRCEEAMAFYEKALGAKVESVMRQKEAPQPPGRMPPGSENKILHASFRIGETVVLASDGHCSGKAEFKGFSLAVSANSDAEAEKFFNALGEGGQIRFPLTETFFSSKFGMVVDKFGVLWMVLVKK